MNTVMYFQRILAFIALILKIHGELLEEEVDGEDKADDDEITLRIVNGLTAEKNMFPFAVALFYRGRYVCTGSVISERDVLTAGHCIVFNGVAQEPRDFHGVVGSVNKREGKKISFVKMTPHPEYDNLMHDIAVLTTEEALAGPPVCLSARKVGCLKPVTAAGWGITVRDTNVTATPDHLQYSHLRVYPNRKCALLYHTKKVPDSVLCAGALNTGLCAGDSGGPLLLKQGRGEWLQVGVASFVNQIFGCARLLGPAGFSRISHYTDFIMKSSRGRVCLQ